MSWQLENSATLRDERVVRRFKHSGNGLSVVLLCDHAAPIVSFNTWYGVGSSSEKPGKTGLAHFFEHLMFTQTRHREAGEFDRIIEGCGGDSNAATSLDYTFYRCSVPSDQLELVVQLEAERMADLDLSNEIIESEREVIMNERRECVDDDVEGLLSEKLMTGVFGTHPYGIPTIGWMADIESLSKTDLESFYRQYYAPNFANLVVVGDCDEEATLGLIDRHYQHLSRTDESDTSFSPPRPPSSSRVEIARPVPADRALYGWLGPAMTDRQAYALDIVALILAGGPSARLYRKLVIEDELASFISCDMFSMKRSGVFEIATFCNAGASAAACEEVIAREIRSVAEEDLSDEELSKAKRIMLTDFWGELTTLDGKGEALGEYETVGGDYRALLSTADTIESLTADDVQRACIDVLDESRKCAIVATPE